MPHDRQRAIIKERLYNYLDGRISHRSFRKWLLSVPNLSYYFGDKDAEELSELIKIYSRVWQIRNILLRHIDNVEFEKYSIYNYLIYILICVLIYNASN